jgi:hypothetical protein
MFNLSAIEEHTAVTGAGELLQPTDGDQTPNTLCRTFQAFGCLCNRQKLPGITLVHFPPHSTFISS